MTLFPEKCVEIAAVLIYNFNFTLFIIVYLNWFCFAIITGLLTITGFP